MRLRRHPLRRGFTLVEMLVVVAIVGILMAILVPLAFTAYRRGKVTRIATELSQLEQAVTTYRDKYKDYPPDFGDTKLGLPFPQTTAYRHIIKVFPNIDPRELNMIACLAPQIDNAESLVFWLGGLSDDPRFPFSGKGGPIRIVAWPDTSDCTTLVVAANRDRNNQRAFAFDDARLGNWLELSPGPGPLTGQALSTDEGKLHGAPNVNDAFPVYAPVGRTEPYVYFDSRTYSMNTGGAAFVSRYGLCAFPQNGVAVPHRSNQRNPNPDPTDPNTAVDANFPATAFYYVNRDSFQILSAGLDGNYGIPLGAPYVIPDPACTWLPTLETIFDVTVPLELQILNQTLYKVYPNGATAREDRDNIANYSEGIFEDKLP